jgi:hypothetical protein
MNEANTQKLIQDIPALYRGALTKDDALKNLMRFGFECGDGWFRLIYDLSANIEKDAYAAGLNPTGEEWPKALQVKAKFGTLRFYISTSSSDSDDKDSLSPESVGVMLSFRPISSNERIRKLISEAEAQSSTICADCGLIGTLRKTSWLHTACDVCEAKKRSKG